MMRTHIAIGLVLLLSTPGCGERSDDEITQIEEVEPNDDTGQPVGGAGSYSINGVCADDFDDDIYDFQAGAGTTTARLVWDDLDGANLDLAAFTDSGAAASDDSSPPDDSPVEIRLSIPEAEPIHVAVVCWNDEHPQRSYGLRIDVR